MKQNTEEPDYRSMNEVQLKYKLIKCSRSSVELGTGQQTTKFGASPPSLTA